MDYRTLRRPFMTQSSHFEGTSRRPRDTNTTTSCSSFSLVTESVYIFGKHNPTQPIQSASTIKSTSHEWTRRKLFLLNKYALDVFSHQNKAANLLWPLTTAVWLNFFVVNVHNKPPQKIFVYLHAWNQVHRGIRTPLGCRTHSHYSTNMNILITTRTARKY